MTYADLRTGLTYRDVYAMMWVNDDDTSRWRCKSRRAVLGFWHELKLAMWDEVEARGVNAAEARRTVLRRYSMRAAARFLSRLRIARARRARLTNTNRKGNSMGTFVTLKSTLVDCRWTDLVTEDAALTRLGMGDIEKGRAFIAGMTAGEMECRAVGAWDATEREAYVMWRSLAAAARRTNSVDE